MSISRIDQEKNNTHGFYVRVSRGGVQNARFFQDRRHGGTEEARGAAGQYNAALLADRTPAREKPLDPRNTSGVTGVSRMTSSHNGRCFWMATWLDGCDRRRRAQFSIKNHGESEARRLAVEARRAGEGVEVNADAPTRG